MADNVLKTREEVEIEAVNRIDELFPGMKWERVNKKGVRWQSGLKVDGTEPKEARKDKSIIYSNNPHIFENGESSKDSVSVFDMWLSFGNGKAKKEDFGKVIGEVAVALGYNYEPPKDYKEDFSDDGKRKFQANKMRKELFGSRGEEALLFLRSATMDNLTLKEVGDMGLGLSIVGDTWNKIAFPLKVGNEIKGFTFRRYLATDNKGGKYCNKKGFDISEYLWNMPRGKVEEVVVVEGIKCALRAEARGMDNVVALGGKEFSDMQIHHLERVGVKRVTLLLDNDEAGVRGTINAIDKLIQAGGFEVFVAVLPGAKDLAEYLGKYYQQGAKQAIRGAAVWYKWRAAQYITSWKNSEGTDKDFSSLRNSIYSLSLRLNTMEREGLFRMVAEEVEGITAEGIDEFVKEEEKRQKLAREEELLKQQANLLANAIQAKDYEQQRKILFQMREIDLSSREERAAELISPRLTLASYQERIKNLPPNVEINKYKLKGFGGKAYPLCLPSGGITLVCGAPGNGKSTFLRNLAFHLSEIVESKSNPLEGEVLYYTLEEPDFQVLEELFNTYYNQALNKRDSNKTNMQCIRLYFQGERECYMEIEKAEQFRLSCEGFSKRFLNSGILNIVSTEDAAEDIVEDIRTAAKQKKIAAVFIDYFQIMRSNKNYKEPRLEMKEICRLLNNLAKDLGLPIVVAAQLNRESYKDLSNLSLKNIAEAADIERIAAQALFVMKGGNKVEISDDDETRLASMGYPSMKERGNMYVRVMKNRLGEEGLEAVYKWEETSGKICGEGEEGIEQPREEEFRFANSGRNKLTPF